MLADMSPSEFEERFAHYRLDPWGDEVPMASAVGASIINEIRQALSGEPLNEGQLMPLDFFLPRKADEGAQRTNTNGSFSSVMRKRIGV